MNNEYTEEEIASYVDNLNTADLMLLHYAAHRSTETLKDVLNQTMIRRAQQMLKWKQMQMEMEKRD